MENEKSGTESKLVRVLCPCCHTTLWYDPTTSEIIKTEKAQKKKSSLDDLLIKEKKKKSDMDRRFSSTAALEKEKRKEALEKFEKAFIKSKSDDDKG